jgi:hypothetical protein
MKKLLFFILFSNSLFAQSIFFHTEKSQYPKRDTTFSITTFIKKADSLSNKYKVNGFLRVDVEYSNHITILFHYSNQGKLTEFLETFEDSIYQSLKIQENDSSFTFSKYNGFYGDNYYREFYYPKDSTIEYWYYGPDDILKKVLKITSLKNRKKEKETIYIKFKGTTEERQYILINNKWVLEKSTTYIEE